MKEFGVWFRRFGMLYSINREPSPEKAKDWLYQNELNRAKEANFGENPNASAGRADARPSADRIRWSYMFDERARNSTNTMGMMSAQQFRGIRCYVYNISLWIAVARIVLGLLLDKSLMTIELYALGSNKYFVLLPMLAIALHGACVSLHFVWNNDYANWRSPFCTRIDNSNGLRKSFNSQDYSTRVKRSLRIAVILVIACSAIVSYYLVKHTIRSDNLGTCCTDSAFSANATNATNATNAISVTKAVNVTSAKSSTNVPLAIRNKGANGTLTTEELMEILFPPKNQTSMAAANNARCPKQMLSEQNVTRKSSSPSIVRVKRRSEHSPGASETNGCQYSSIERAFMTFWTVLDVIWIIHVSCISVFVPVYFNFISSTIKGRFTSMSEKVKDWAENLNKKNLEEAKQLTDLQIEHFETCQLVDESATFWNRYLLGTYICFVSGFFYTGYNVFYLNITQQEGLIIWTMMSLMLFTLLSNAYSAASLSLAAHSAGTWLKQLRFAAQLPPKVKTSVELFYTLTNSQKIGYSCGSIFVMSYSSTIGTGILLFSYFCILADFSRTSSLNLFKATTEVVKTNATEVIL